MAIQLASPAFDRDSIIPRRYTCDSEDISPELGWTGVPDQTQSLALIVDDPDAPDPAAPKMIWVHWILYNIQADLSSLPQACKVNNLPGNAMEGFNDWKTIAYRGPCPPIGRHRYFFKLYALDVALAELRRPTKGQLEQAMEGHILAQATLMGTYQKGDP